MVFCLFHRNKSMVENNFVVASFGKDYLNTLGKTMMLNHLEYYNLEKSTLTILQ